MKKKILAFCSALILLITSMPLSPLSVTAKDADTTAEEEPLVTTEPAAPEVEGETYIEGFVEASCFGEDVVFLEKGEKLYATLTLDQSLGEDVTYAWQLLTANGKWTTVRDYVLPYAVISEALIANARQEDGAALVRCIVSANGEKYVSSILTVFPPVREDATVEDEPVSTFSLRSARSTDADEGDAEADETEETESVETEPLATLMSPAGTISADAFHIVINYTYLHPYNPDINGATAANTFTVTLPEGGFYTGTIATPPEIGYLPYVHEDQIYFVTDVFSDADINQELFVTIGEDRYYPANSIQFENHSDEITVNVYFLPQEVTYCVKVYEQNLYDDEYTLAETITYTGIANSTVGEGLDKPREGFSPLYYDPKLPISEDGSFVLDIYYDRNYYLVDFELNDNGESFGAANYYVRYQTPIVLMTPTRPGYSFINWTLDLVTDENKEVVTSHFYSATAVGNYLLPSVEHNLTYSASWKVEKTSYTVIYWLENANDENFTLDSFVVVEGVTPGAEVSASDKPLSTDYAKYFTFNELLSDKNVIVAADGTTAVNAYYLRNYYTLAFKGGTHCITPEHKHDATCNSLCVTADGVKTEAHTHTAACGLGDRTCGKEEHIHVDACCSLEEHAHDSSCCSIPYHVHGTGAASDCIKTEHPIHHATCYSRDELRSAEDGSLTSAEQTAFSTLKSKLSSVYNGYVYRVRPTRNGTIYNFLFVHEQWFYLGSGTNYNGVTAKNIKNPGNSAGSTSSAAATLICGLDLHTHGDGTCDCPITEHDHTEGCTCSIPRHVHGEGTCANTKCGKEYHRHTISCYTFLCGKEAHTHTARCVRTCQLVEHTHGNCNTTTTTKEFLTVKCKYNQDISKVWPAVWELFPDGQRWKANTYFSEVLVYLPFMPPASITFTVNVKDGTKEIYTIHYYLESLDETGKVYNGKYFTLNNTVNANYGHLTPDEDFFDIAGFTQFASDPGFTSGKIDTNGGDVYMYYARNEYQLEFVSLGTTLSPFTKTLKYQQPIGESCELLAEDVPYPSTEEPGAIQFAGWYTTPNCADGTEFAFDGNTIMPEGGLVLYAKWEPCSYRVNIYTNKEMTEMLTEPQTVLFGSYLEEPNYNSTQQTPTPDDPEHPDTPNYTEAEKMIFTGWYYMDGATEKRFDFNTMPVKTDMDIYAKWTSHIPVPFTIRYVYWDGSDYVDIAEPTTGASLAGITKTFSAKVDADLLDDYQEGYFPEMRAHSMTMSSDPAENVYLFVYSIPEEIHYNVIHTFSSTEITKFFEDRNAKSTVLTATVPHTISGESIADSAASVVVSFRESITKDFIAAAAAQNLGRSLSDTEKNTLWGYIIDLSPDHYLKNLTLTSMENNDAQFTWSKQSEGILYQTIYYIESVDGTEYTIHSTKTNIALKGTTVSAVKENIEHFTLNEAISTLSGKVVQPGNEGSNELSKGLVLSLYYTRKSYPYTVYHHKEGSNVSLVPGEPVTKWARYQEEITVADEAVEITGYTLTNGAEKVKIVGSGENKIYCKYKGLEVFYQYQVLGIGGSIAEPTATIAIGGEPPKPRTIELWNDDDGSFYFNGWYYAVDSAELQPVPEEWLSNNGMTVTLDPPEADLAGKTVYVYAEVLPTLRRFKVEGFTSAENDPQAFVFRLQGAEAATEHIDLTFIIFDAGHTDLARLPYGTYTLTTLRWAWRYGTPDEVVFNGVSQNATAGQVTLNLNTTGDVTIVYPEKAMDQWLSDDASGHVPLN